MLIRLCLLRRFITFTNRYGMDRKDISHKNRHANPSVECYPGTSALAARTRPNVSLICINLPLIQFL